MFSHYTALSYVWGPPQKVETIWIDERPLKITANLFSALRDLRDDTRPFFLWADGICINQEDDQEKNLQVQMMGQIYAGASNTIIYHGPADANSKECLCILSARQGHKPTDADALASIFQNEWFTRVWVFQELLLSSNPWMQCGRARAKWETMYLKLASGFEGHPSLEFVKKMQQAWSILESRLAAVPGRSWEIVQEMHRAWSNRNLFRQDTNMLQLIHPRRGLGVSDPRDMIFAHIGFAGDGGKKILREKPAVDYSKTCVQVFTDFALDIGRGNTVTLLDFVGDSKSQTRIQNLPSWVPDLTVPIPTRRFPIHYHPSVNVGEDEDEDEPEISDFGRKLQTPTFILRFFSTILATTSEILLRQIPIDVRRSIASKLAKIPMRRYDEYDGETLIWVKPEAIALLRKVWRKVYQTWRDVLANDEILSPKPLDLEIKWYDRDICVCPSVAIYLILAFGPDHNTNYLNGKALAKLTCGKLALVPVSAQRGDLVVPFTSVRHSKEFVFRTVPSMDDRASVDAETIKWAKSSLPVGEADFIGDDSVLHCEFVGECLRGNFWTRGKDFKDAYGESRQVIMTLH